MIFELSNLYSLLFDISIKAAEVVVILLVAWLIDVIIRGLVKKLYMYLKIDSYLREHKLQDALFNISLLDVINKLVSLYIFVLAFAVIGNVLMLDILSTWSINFLNYLPSLVQGIAIMLIGFYLGDYIGDKIRDQNFILSSVLGAAVQFFVIYTSLVIALPAILPAISTRMLENFFVVVSGALALGLAVGIGLGIGLGLQSTFESLAKKHKKAFEDLLK